MYSVQRVYIQVLWQRLIFDLSIGITHTLSNRDLMI